MPCAGKTARRLAAPRRNAAIARHRFRQARSRAGTRGACFDTLIDCTVEADWDCSSAAVADIAVDWKCSSVAEADIAVGRNSSWDQGPKYHTDRTSRRRRPAARVPVRMNNPDRKHSRGRTRSPDRKGTHHKRTHKERHNPDKRLHRKIRDRRTARTNVE